MSPSHVLLMTCLSLIGLAKGRYLCGSTMIDVLGFVCEERGFERDKLDVHKLIDECCLNICDYQAIESYCNPWPTETPETIPNDAGDAAETPEFPYDKFVV